MNTLHWHTADKPCTLLGKEVTPESWIGGVARCGERLTIIEALGSKHGLQFTADGDDLEPCDIPQPDQFAALIGNIRMTQWPQTDFIPIYPPVGWAGKTEAELWEAITGRAFLMDLGAGVSLIWEPPYSPNVSIPNSETLGSLYHDPGHVGATAAELPALILALGNAHVLQRRLTEAQL